MACFLVSYDLIKLKDYAKLIAELKRYDGHKCLLSAWLITADSTAAQMRDHLKQFIDDDDRLIVVELSKKPAPWKCFQGTADWIAARFNR